jgi:hypothetical protein
LCRQGLITANNVGHSEKIDTIGWLLELVEQGLQDRSHAWNRSKQGILSFEGALQGKICGCGLAEMTFQKDSPTGSRKIPGFPKFGSMPVLLRATAHGKLNVTTA